MGPMITSQPPEGVVSAQPGQLLIVQDETNEVGGDQLWYKGQDSAGPTGWRKLIAILFCVFLSFTAFAQFGPTVNMEYRAYQARLSGGSFLPKNEANYDAYALALLPNFQSGCQFGFRSCDEQPTSSTGNHPQVLRAVGLFYANALPSQDGARIHSHNWRLDGSALDTLCIHRSSDAFHLSKPRYLGLWTCLWSVRGVHFSTLGAPPIGLSIFQLIYGHIETSWQFLWLNNQRHTGSKSISSAPRSTEVNMA